MTTGLNKFTGKVVELLPKSKAIVQFQLNNKSERALLWFDKYKVNGRSLPEDRINNSLSIGMPLTFLCHKFDESGVDRCAWYITCGWNHGILNDNVTHGYNNIQGTIKELAKRQGILVFTDSEGKEQNVRFLASKLFLHGKRLNSKMNLEKVSGIEVDSQLWFDAVPCEQADDNQCKWFATVVWKGKKPAMYYDSSNTFEDDTSISLLTQIRQVVLNPRCFYLRSEGQIVKIVNEEWGIALGATKVNYWESILFHRSVCYLFKISLANEDLTKVFKEGDKIYFLAVSAPKHMAVRWLAAKVRVFVDTSTDTIFEN